MGLGGFALGETEDAEIVFGAGGVVAADADLEYEVIGAQIEVRFARSKSGLVWVELTVLVISAEHTSHTYFTPPSPGLAAVFLRITPMVAYCSRSVAPGVETVVAPTLCRLQHGLLGVV